MAYGDQPIGTLEEIQALGMDPSLVCTCAPHAKDGSVRGCPQETNCIFAQARYGGFKGKGAKNVGFFKRLSKADRGSAQRYQFESYMPCFNFVHTLAEPMRQGQLLEEQGRDHTHIEIIGQEGDTIFVTHSEAVDKRPDAKDIRMKETTEEIVIPRFPRPGEGYGPKHNQLLDKRAELRAAQRQQVEHEQSERASESRAERLAEHRASLLKADGQTVGPAPVPATATAMPVKRNKGGRPRKAAPEGGAEG